MPSTLTWLNTSDHERQQALDVIDMFRHRDTRDELGVGAIRDGFADAFFPGTSTIQTRAAYFLLIPWIYRQIEARRVGSSDVAGHARRAEIGLISALLQGDDTDGVIGQNAGKSLKRLPSEVYWSGLRTWGIRQVEGSREQYHRRIQVGALGGPASVDLEADGERRAPSGWHPNLPAPPDGFPDSARMELRREDADYLAERILVRCPGTLLAHLVEQPTFEARQPFLWLDSGCASAPEPIGILIEQARRFSVLMRGAPLLYNRLIAKEREEADLVVLYDEGLNAWAEECASAPWDHAAFWETCERTRARVDPRTRAFVDAWTNLASDDPDSWASDRAAELIRLREREVKRHQARLGRPDALWGGAAGVGQLDYRWGTAWVLLRDIARGREVPGA